MTEGIEKLSMRRLARALGHNPMSPYRHGKPQAFQIALPGQSAASPCMTGVKGVPQDEAGEERVRVRDAGDPCLRRPQLGEPLQPTYTIGSVGQRAVGAPEASHGLHEEVHVSFPSRIARPQTDEQGNHQFGTGGDVQANRIVSPDVKRLYDGLFPASSTPSPTSRSSGQGFALTNWQPSTFAEIHSFFASRSRDS